MRAFLALEIPEEIKKYLSVVSKKMSQVTSGVKWVKSDGLHVTLKFFGEIDDAMAYKIGDALANIGEQHRAVAAQLKEISAFPDLRRPRVIIVTFQEGVDNLRAIFHDIESRLAVLDEGATLPAIGQARAPVIGEFIPHITLGRVKGATSLLKRGAMPLEEKKFIIDTVVLFRSTLTQTGAIYTPLKEIHLKGIFDEKGRA
jgi:2'-5' RNA ligase